MFLCVRFGGFVESRGNCRIYGMDSVALWILRDGFYDFVFLRVRFCGFALCVRFLDFAESACEILRFRRI